MNVDAVEGLVHAAETGMSPWLLLAAFVVGTFISEDLTCVTAGVLVARGDIGYVPAMLASLAGIYIGDILLYLLGRYVGRMLLEAKLTRRWIRPERIESSEAWFARRGPAVILISRFVPGSRLPVYVASGMLRLPLRRVAVYFGLAGLLWTPLLVGLAALLGGHVIAYLERFTLVARWTFIVSAIGIWLCIRLLAPLMTFKGRRLFVGRIKRWRRWEFWPMWAFYPPIVAYVVALMARYRSPTLFTLANPCMPHGGFIGESKSQILSRLAHAGDHVARSALIEPADVETRMRVLARERERLALSYPFVLKPDVGQRGEGVAVIRSDAECARYLEQVSRPVLLQAYAPGREFGVFYYRMPDEAKGHIFSVTEKRMPVVTGDGRSTLEQLILRDPRAVCMAEFYLHKQGLHASAVVPAGEEVQLVEIGTHCRGAIFLDGAWVMTPELEAVIERISTGLEGFYFGRYDIRTPSVEDFRKGRNFTIIELNGVTSEATHIYDPANRLRDAQRVLRRQWELAFEIGARNRARGLNPSSPGALWRAWRDFERAPELE